MKYPIDAITTEHLLGQLITHERAQRALITSLSLLLADAMAAAEYDDEGWYVEAKAFLKAQKQLKADHETRLFNEKNGHAEKNETKLTPETANKAYQNTMPAFGLVNIEDPELAQKLNQTESKFGEELSESELERMFGEKKKPRLKKGVDLEEVNPFHNMTLEEINKWEAEQNNSNDIYKVKARVANLARSSGGSLTPVGEMMVNTFVHVVMDLYAFADTIPDKEMRIKLIERVRKHEGMPGTLIDAATAGVRNKK